MTTTLRNLTGVLVTFALFLVSTVARADEPQPSYAYSVFNNLRYPPDFTHFDYANPDAPKGGSVKMGINGSFDSLNDLVVKGDSAAGIGHIYETLMSASADELGANYGLIADSITVAPDHSWAEYHINPKARWHDGKPITVEDVMFSYEILRDKSAPIWRGFLSDVKDAEITGSDTIRFNFVKAGRHKAPYLMGGLRIYPKHFWEGKDFEATSMEPPLGSSAYRITNVEQGRTITYERVKDYWAKDLPTKKGLQNFDKITYEYYRDENSRFEAFKSGNLNHRTEGDAPRWAQSYNFAAVKNGDVVQTELKNEDPAWILTYALNMRRDKFKDRRVREAFLLAYDFDWLNKNFLFGLHDRTDSYFDASVMGATGLPSPKELELLNPFRGKIPDEVFEKPFEIHRTDGSGNNRKGLVRAMQLLKEAGWEVKDGTLTHGQTGETFTAELLVNNALMARVASPWISALKRLGVKADIRQVDTSQYFNRISEFDYDIMVIFLPQQSMPTRELKDFWGSYAADRPGSLNFAGIKNEAVDALLDIITDSNNQEEYFAAIKAVDRILLWSYYQVPMFHTPESWRAHVKEMKHLPRTGPMYDHVFPASWWWEESD